MNAIEMLTQQHREVEDLFQEFEGAGKGARGTKEKLCKQICDALAVHAEIEERIFYPEAKDATGDAEELLRRSVEEHLTVKRLIAEILDTSIDDPQLDARMQVLREQVEHHVEEEESELFPEVKDVCSADQLSEMGDRMGQLADQLEEAGEPSAAVRDQTDKPASI